MANLTESTASIGIFDSGFGGLTVMKAIRDLLPNEDLIYLGDAARLPYGNKSPATVIRYTLESARFLAGQKIKLIVIACHTAASVSLDALEQELYIPVIGVIEPCLPDLIESASRGVIGVLATRATISSQVYQKALQSYDPAIGVIGVACPLFVPLVEEGLMVGSIASETVKHYLAPLKAKGVNTLLLGCTHYPLLQKEIQEFMGPSCRLIDPSIHCAHFVKAFLMGRRLLNPSNAPSQSLFFTTDDPEKFQELGPKFLHRGIGAVSKVILS